MFAFLGEEFGADLFFQSLDGLGEGGLGEVELRGGFGEVAVLRDECESAEFFHKFF